MANGKAVKRKVNTGRGRVDITFLSIILILLTVGLVMLFSASYAYSLEYYNSSYKFIIRQAGFAAVGLLVMYITSKIDYHIYKRFAWLIYIATTVILVVLLLIPPMVSGMDVKRWFVVGPINFQPSEFAKFSVILLLSTLIAPQAEKLKNFKFIAEMLVIIALPCVLVIAEPHVSATVLIFCIGIVLLFIGGLPMKYMIGGGVLGAAGVGGLLATGVIGYGSDRIKYWLDPWADASGKGFQTIQSLLAIGSGGILGRGIGQSRQKHLYLPEPHNDFIFAVVCEELGLIGAVIIILLFCLLVWRGFSIAMHAKDKFGSLLAVGLTFQVGLQAMLNIWVVTNTIPNTGISLPFFSYGGSALVILLAEMGIVLSVSREANLEKS